jgi:hypothetical protein
MMMLYIFVMGIVLLVKEEVVPGEVKLECSDWKGLYCECFCNAIQELD